MTLLSPGLGVRERLGSRRAPPESPEALARSVLSAPGLYWDSAGRLPSGELGIAIQGGAAAKRRLRWRNGLRHRSRTVLPRLRHTAGVCPLALGEVRGDQPALRVNDARHAQIVRHAQAGQHPETACA